MAIKKHNLRYIKEFETEEAYNEYFGDKTDLSKLPSISYIKSNGLTILDAISKDIADYFIVKTVCDKNIFYVTDGDFSDVKATVTVTLKFSQNKVRAHEIPVGWNENKEDSLYSYTYGLNAEKMVCPATEFKYKIPNVVKDRGKVLSKFSKEMRIGIIGTAWYGLMTDKMIESQDYLSNLTEVFDKVDTIADFKNTYNEDAYMYVVAKEPPTFSQFGINMLKEIAKDMTVLVNGNEVKLTGYTLYRSINSIESGSMLNSVTIKIQN